MALLRDSILKHAPNLDHAFLDMHLRRMPDSYVERNAPADIARHLRLLARLTEDDPVAVEVKLLGGQFHEVVAAGFDQTGVVSAVYAKKGRREMASVFADGTNEVLFGPEAAGLYPLKYAATGFLRLRAEVLRRMIAELGLPLCNTHWGRGVWPFFLPLVVSQGPGQWHYLGEDWAFSHRLGQIGVIPLADTTIRLWYWGRYGFSWEDAGADVRRYRSYSYRIG